MKIAEPAAAVSGSLRRRVKQCLDAAREMERHLSKHPDEWGKFQSVFNFEINGVFRELMEFERDNLEKGNEDRVYKLKRLFVNRIRKGFLHGDYIVWSLQKPLGYAGDFKIIDAIYLNSPRTLGFGRLYDNYFQMSAISVAVRNRKDDFKKMILGATGRNPQKPVRIMNLGSGPGRDLAELFLSGPLGGSNAVFHCYDSDERAHCHARQLLGAKPGVRYVKENVVRLALKREIESAIPERFDLIYSCGLFDYLDERVSIRLIQNLKKLLTKDGQLAISDVRDKYSNPSVHFMEWVGDWNLIYREDGVFRRLFVEAGFEEKRLQIGYEQQGIMQYVTATP